MIQIKSYSPEFEEAHIKFASKYWTKGRRKNPEFIYWKFRGKPNAELPSFILAIDNDEVVGQLGIIPCIISIEDKIYDAQWACDLMVDEDYRGKNIAKQLYDYAHNSKSITLGSNPSVAASKSMRRNGYKSLKSSWKFIFPIKIGEITKLKGYTIKLLNKIGHPLLLFKHFFKNDFYKISEDQYVCNYRMKRKHNQAYVVHDENFVKWRYHSFKHYYKEVSMYSNSYGSYFSGFFNNNVYYITDFEVNTFKEFFKIVYFIVNQHKKESLLRIKFFSNISFLNRWLLFFGFVKFRTQTEIIYFTTELLESQLKGRYFYYTLLDSDENI